MKERKSNHNNRCVSVQIEFGHKNDSDHSLMMSSSLDRLQKRSLVLKEEVENAYLNEDKSQTFHHTSLFKTTSQTQSPVELSETLIHKRYMKENVDNHEFAHDTMREINPSIVKNSFNNSSNRNINNIPLDCTQSQKKENKITYTEDPMKLYHFLTNLNIEPIMAKAYSKSLKKNGFDSISSLTKANAKDLKEIGIKIGHVRKIKHASCVCTIAPSSSTEGFHHDDSISPSRKSTLQQTSTFHNHNNTKHERQSCGRNKILSKSDTNDFKYNDQNQITCGSHNRNTLKCENDNDDDILASSVTNMDEAKIKIKMQEQKIRRLESTLAKTSLSLNARKKKIPTDDNNKPISKMLSPEERLQAHRKRKMIENKHKETSYQWEKPPPLQRTYFTRKVKKKETLVDKLAANPLERRRQHKIEKKKERQLENNFNISSDLENTSAMIEPISSKKNGKKFTNRTAVTAEIISMNNSSKQSLHVENTAYKERSKRGVLSDRINAETFSYKSNDTPSFLVNQCETCNATLNCEEDMDNPGTFYCAQCWSDYYEGYDQVPSSCNIYTERQSLNKEKYENLSKSTANLEPSNSKNDQGLWILHDNPQLGDRLLIKGRSMKCWVESKDKDKNNCLRVMIGRIDYSGDMKRASLDTKCDINTPLGTECIRLRDVLGYKINYDDAVTRISRDKSITEFQLKKNDGIKLMGNDAQLSTKDFMQNCHGSVDVIFDPQCATGDWYPFRETETKRKLAPQFRSKGVGYIRLGDDMSRNGLAFLSSDGCKTFFSTILSKSDPKYGVDISNKKSIYSSEMTKKRASQRSMVSVVDDVEQEKLMKECIKDSIHDPKDLLKELRESEGNVILKWDEKAFLINRLGDAISCASGIQFAGQALIALQNILSQKNVNIFVLKSTVQSISSIGYSLKKDLVSHAAWRTIFVEILNLLKSKQLSSQVRKTLWNLHGRCFTLSNTMELICQVLGFGKTERLSTLKKGKKTTSSLSSIDTTKKAGNNVEMIEWLATTIMKECEMQELDHIVDSPGLELLAGFFLSLVGHRDQKCRMHVYNGLAHTIIYGAKWAHLKREKAFSLCSDLEMTNPRAWKTVLQRVKSCAY